MKVKTLSKRVKKSKISRIKMGEHRRIVSVSLGIPALFLFGGHVPAENCRTQERFACIECGFEENADLVGAINVLRAGDARLACEVSGAVRPPAAGTRRGESALAG